MSSVTETNISQGLHTMDILGAKLAGDPPESYTTPPSPLLLIVLSGVLYGILMIFLSSAEYNEIRQNWSAYRCSPAVMPFAKFYGHDLNETINFCMQQAVKEHAPGVIEPIYRAVADVTTTMDSTFDKAVAIEEGVSSLLVGFDSFVTNFVNSMRLVGTRMRMSVVRINEIFGRIHGIFIAFAFAAISAITFGESLACNPLVTFMGTITGVDVCCFPPGTPVLMQDGSVKPMELIRIGDVLGSGCGRVTSIYDFLGDQTELVQIGTVQVSRGHYVFLPSSSSSSEQLIGNFVEAGEHPDSIPVSRVPRLVCLATNTHRIPILNHNAVMIFADYEESDDPEVLAEAKKIAETLINEKEKETKESEANSNTIIDYSLGLDPDRCFISIDHQSVLQLRDVQLGDRLINGTHVVGIIQEECSTIVEFNSMCMSASMLVKDDNRCDWTRVCNRVPATKIKILETPIILTHLLLGGDHMLSIQNADGKQFWVRDYCEIEDDLVQAPFSAAIEAITKIDLSGGV